MRMSLNLGGFIRMWLTNKKEVRRIIGDKGVLKLDEINPSGTWPRSMAASLAVFR